MSVNVIDADKPGPFVIDRAPPSWIERAPGVASLVVDPETTETLEFDTAEDARRFLIDHISGGEWGAWRWRIVPKAKEPLDR